jgi:hypothetical protein
MFRTLVNRKEIAPKLKKVAALDEKMVKGKNMLHASSIINYSLSTHGPKLTSRNLAD